MNNHSMQSVDIRPASMTIENAVKLYKALDDVGKACFVDQLNIEDRQKLIETLKSQTLNRGMRLKHVN